MGEQIYSRSLHALLGTDRPDDRGRPVERRRGRITGSFFLSVGANGSGEKDELVGEKRGEGHKRIPLP